MLLVRQGEAFLPFLLAALCVAPASCHAAQEEMPSRSSPSSDFGEMQEQGEAPSPAAYLKTGVISQEKRYCLECIPPIFPRKLWKFDHYC